MTRSDDLRAHLVALKAWVEHWQTDRICNLVPTESSLILAKSHADSALTLLDRLEAEHRETA